MVRRPLSIHGSRLLTGRHTYQCCKSPCLITRYKSSKGGPTNGSSSNTSSGSNGNKGDIFPTVHPKRERLLQMKNILKSKDPNFKISPSASSESWTKKDNKKPAPEPTRHELYVVALHQAIPFVGFGIMDNAILIIAGEAIDIYLGVTLGISTMCAAAIGNIVSDLSGVAFGTIIEDALLSWSKKIEKMTNGRIRLPPMPKLTYDQRQLRSVRWSGQLGCAVGLTIGCIIGMFPLVFFPDDPHKNEEDGGGDDNTAASSAVSQKVNNDQNEQLKKEISQWKEKYAETMKRLDILEKEKTDGLWDRGY